MKSSLNPKLIANSKLWNRINEMYLQILVKQKQSVFEIQSIIKNKSKITLFVRRKLSISKIDQKKCFDTLRSCKSNTSIQKQFPLQNKLLV